MTKVYVLDTNVLLSDFMAYRQFKDNVVVIPSVVLEEIDNKKKLMDAVGFNARAFGRELDALRASGRLSDGVDLDNGGKLVVYLMSVAEKAINNFANPINDDLIISTALALKSSDEYENIPVILVSKDALVRVKADALGIQAEDFLGDKVLSANEDRYTGVEHIDSDAGFMSTFKQVGWANLLGYGRSALPNTHGILKSGTYEVPGRFDENGTLHVLHKYKGGQVFGITSRNAEQAIALDMLLDPAIPLVTLVGKAGTGKTLLALAAALEQTMEAGSTYDKVLVARPVIPMGKDIGYLPGEIEDKLRPWIQPIYDNLEYIFNCRERKDSLERILAGIQGKLEVQALTYVRGRSIPNQLIIIDEAQNLTTHEVKTILTRAGEGSKVVLMGDPEQIDSPYLDQYNNGLTYVVERMKHLDISGHIELSRGERSKLAEISADLL